MDYNLTRNSYGNDMFFKIKKFLISLWMMYVLFPFRLKGIVTIQNIIYYGISFLCLIIFFKKINNLKLNSVYLGCCIFYLFIFIVLILLSYLIPIKRNTLDFSYLNNFIYYFGRVLILTGTVILVKGVFEYINLIIDAVNNYVIFSILLLIPSLHNAYMGLVLVDNLSIQQINDLYGTNYYTRFGLQGFSGFGSTIMCTISVLLSCYLVIQCIQENRKLKKYVWKIILSLIGNAMYGRTGFLISLVIIIITAIYVTVFYKKIIFFLIFCIALSLIFSIFIFNTEKLEQIDSIRWMFEGFFNYLDYGKFTTSSTNHLKSMYVHPTINTFLYGDGYYTIGTQYYMLTDVGFLRPLLFFGIFGEVLYYSLLIPSFISLNKFLNKRNNLFFLFSSLIFIIVFEFKGEVLLTFSSILYSLSVSILLNTGKIRR